MSTDRIQNIRSAFSRISIDALLVTDIYNIYYSSGFSVFLPGEREAYVVITKKNIYLLSDARYVDDELKTKSQRSNITVLLLTPAMRLSRRLQEIFDQETIRNVGFESEDLRFAEYETLKRKLPEIKFQATSNIILKIRSVKNKKEIDLIRKACRMCDECLNDIVPAIKIGSPEKQIAQNIESWIRNKGLKPAFDPIVAVDEHAALPHYNTQEGTGTVQKNSAVLIDFGIQYSRYVSDITRMFFVGSPEPGIIQAYKKLLEVQTHAAQMVKVNGSFKDIDGYCRKSLVQKGYPEFGHSTGHGVGLEVHESPKVSAFSNETISPGHVFTIEPGIYREGRWGLRIEDTVCVHPNGEVEVLTKFPKTLRIIS